MPVEIIAEVAQGFEGRPEQAQLLMRAAAAAGADAVKYQLVYADELATPGYRHYALFRSLEMDDSVWESLAGQASRLGIHLQLDIFGARSLALAERLGVRTVKLHGTDIANAGFLRDVADSGVPRILLGAGGAFAGELDEAVGTLAAKELVVLLGFQGYPTATDTNNLTRIPALIERLRNHPGRATVGFADHADPTSALSYALPAMAIGLGATTIEKHLTLSRIMELEDHESALSPEEFSLFAEAMRGCLEALGQATKADDFGMTAAEQGYRRAIRRSVVAKRGIEPGTRVGPSDVVLKRSQSENAITELRAVYGKTLKRQMSANDPFEAEDVS